MSTITTKDGTEIYYKDWGPKNAQPIMFHHGWPLSGDATIGIRSCSIFSTRATASSPMIGAATAVLRR